MADRLVLDRVADGLRLPALEPAEVRLAEGVHVGLDGADAARSCFVEVCEHTGELAGGTKRRVAAAMLKLVAVRGVYARAVLWMVFTSQEAAASLPRWVQLVAAQHDIRIHVLVESPRPTRAVQSLAGLVLPP